LSFDLSFDNVFFEHWLGLQTIVRGIPVSVPLCHVVATAFNRGYQDLLFVLPFVTQLLLAGPCGSLFQPLYPCFRNLLSLLALLHDHRASHGPEFVVA